MPGPERKKFNSGILVVGLILILLIIGLQSTTKVFAPDPEKDAWGKILQTVRGGETGNQLTVIGETQDIASGNHIWVAAEDMDRKRCRPGKHVLRNTRFRARLEMDDYGDEVWISICLLDDSAHKLWQDWTEKEAPDGLPLNPDIRRLDSFKAGKN